MWQFIGIIILIAIIFGITPHEAFWGVVGVVFGIIVVVGVISLAVYLFTKPKSNATIDGNKKEVEMERGNVDAATIGQIPEGEIVKKPTRTYKPWEVAKGLFMGAIKLIPITLLLMAIMWGISYLLAR